MSPDVAGIGSSIRPASFRGAVGRLRLRAARACGWAAMATVVLPLLMILKLQGERPDMERIRIAASACTDDRVRVALEHIADGRAEDTTLEAATRGEAGGQGDEAT